MQPLPAPSSPDAPPITIESAAIAVNVMIEGADETLYRLTGWPTVRAMLVCTRMFPTYRPTCHAEFGTLPVADIFDAAMLAIGDPRRADRVA